MTEHSPKCLLTILNSQTILEHQINTLLAGGIDRIVVVGGFMFDKIEAHLLKMSLLPTKVRSVFNPFFSVSDNLASFWVAKVELDEDVIVLNGDTLFEEEIVRRLLKQSTAPIRVAADKKQTYDADDMKLKLEGSQITEISKEVVDPAGEAIGLYLITKQAFPLIERNLDQLIQDSKGLRCWFPELINSIAQQRQISVEAISIQGLKWGEIDTVDDIGFVKRKFSES